LGKENPGIRAAMAIVREAHESLDLALNQGGKKKKKKEKKKKTKKKKKKKIIHRYGRNADETSTRRERQKMTGGRSQYLKSTEGDRIEGWRVAQKRKKNLGKKNTNAATAEVKVKTEGKLEILTRKGGVTSLYWEDRKKSKAGSQGNKKKGTVRTKPEEVTLRNS